MNKLVIAMMSLAVSVSSLAFATEGYDHADEIKDLKTQIVALAQSYQGQGDPDFSKQKSLDVLVAKLLAVSPQSPVKERLPFLYGAWKQVWGPYDYRNDDRGVDPQLGVAEIYQVVFEDGYYYNVAPSYKKGRIESERIGLLRGEFKLDGEESNLLRVRFTTSTGLDSRPADLPLWDLPSLAESNELEGEVTRVPSLLVRLLFGGGALREVYTDNDLRILYGSNGSNFKNEFIYVMTKVN